MSNGLPPGVPSDFEEHQKCLASHWAELPPHPKNDTSEFPSPAWNFGPAAGIMRPTTISGCSALSVEIDGDNERCVTYPSVLTKTIFNMGGIAPSKIAAKTDLTAEQSCAQVCAAQSIENGPTQKCGSTAITNQCGSGDNPYSPTLNCYPQGAASSEQSCPRGGYIFDSGTSMCSCASAALWFLTGEVSPWDTLGESDQAKLLKAYEALQATTLTNPNIIDPKTNQPKVYNFPPVSVTRGLLTGCKTNEIAKKDQEATDTQIAKGVIALVFALILCFVLFKLVWAVYMSHKAAA
jgi:hypothetical protein